MKRFVLFGLLIVLAVAAGFYFVRDPGTADIALLGWELQTSALGLLVILGLAFVILLMVWRLLSAVFGLPRYWRRHTARQRQKAADEELLRAWAEQERGRHAAAEKLALVHRAHGSLPPLHFVVAMDALLSRGDVTAALNLLDDVRGQYPRFADFLALHLANRLRRHQNYPQALDLLHSLSLAHPKDEAILCAFAETLYAAEDWAKLRTLLPALRRLKWPGLTEQDVRRYELAVAGGLMAEASRHSDAEQLRTLWNDVPKQLAKEPTLIALHARAWVQMGQRPEAQRLLEKALKQDCSPELLQLWLELPPADPTRSRAQFESWTKQPSCVLDERTSAYARAQLAWLNEDLSLAQRELAKALAETPTVAALKLAAQIHEHQRDSVQALALYKQAVARLESTAPTDSRLS